MPPTHTPPPAEAVAPLTRGISVLRRLTDAGGTLSLSHLERATGLARSTVDRIVATLARMGYVRLDGRDVTLAPRLLELGNAYLAALRLPTLLGEHADALADDLAESVSLAVSDGDGIRFVHQALRRRTMALGFRVGDLLPAERTAPGPLFAAEWTEAEWSRWRERRAADPEDHGFAALPPGGRAPVAEPEFTERTKRAGDEGWALDDQLIEPGLVAVALPVRAPGTDRIACAASVVSHTSRHSAASLREALLPRLRTTVAAMERELRVARPLPPSPSPPPSGLATWTGAAKQELGSGFVESLARGLTALTAFDAGRDTLTLSAVAEATGLARATVRRALLTLDHLGYVTAHGRTFQLTPRVLDLGFSPLSRTTLPEIAQPHLAALAERVGDSSSLAVLAGDDVQYLARVAASRIMSVQITVWTRFPAYATSTGRVLLAGLPADDRAARLARAPVKPLTPRTVTERKTIAALVERARHEGYSLVDEEVEEGLRSIAVPVRDRTGIVVAAVDVAMHSRRRSVEDCLTSVLPELRAAATRIETDLHVTERFAGAPAAR